jgi:hypothetical protein
VHVVFRRQPDQLRSLYLQYVKTGGGASVEEFLTHRGWPLHVTPGYFRYAEYVEALQARFTASRVHVYLFEDLRADAEGWLRAWCGALCVPEDGWPRDILAARDNPGIAPRVVPWLRAANRVAGGVGRGGKPGDGAEKLGRDAEDGGAGASAGVGGSVGGNEGGDDVGVGHLAVLLRCSGSGTGVRRLHNPRRGDR